MTCSGFRQQYRVGLQRLLIVAKGTLSNGETIPLFGKTISVPKVGSPWRSVIDLYLSA